MNVARVVKDRNERQYRLISIEMSDDIVARVKDKKKVKMRGGPFLNSRNYEAFFRALPLGVFFP